MVRISFLTCATITELSSSIAATELLDFEASVRADARLIVMAASSCPTLSWSSCAILRRSSSWRR